MSRPKGIMRLVHGPKIHATDIDIIWKESSCWVSSLIRRATIRLIGSG